MTKEEAIWAIKDVCLTTEQLTRIEKALECLLSQPSLPSDLDEAAFEYEDSSEYPPANQEEERMVYDAFKAGAEWMAGQGEKETIEKAAKWIRDHWREYILGPDADGCIGFGLWENDFRKAMEEDNG